MTPLLILTGILLATAAVAEPPPGDLDLGATEILIDFDDYPPGTVIDLQYPEVKFATEPGVEIQTASVPFAPSPPNIICTVPVESGDTAAWPVTAQ